MQEALAAAGLPSVGAALHHVLWRYIERLFPPEHGLAAEVLVDVTPLPVLAVGLSRPARSREAHPQLRKFLPKLSDWLDERWAEALARRRPQGEAPRGREAAALLGCLPLEFDRLAELLEQALDSADAGSRALELSPLQWFALTTGHRPAPPGVEPKLLDSLVKGNSDRLSAFREDLVARQRQSQVPAEVGGAGGRRLQESDPATGATAAALLDDWYRFEILVDELIEVEELRRLRTAADLKLGELYPRTVAILGAAVGRVALELVGYPVEEVADSCRRVSAEVFAGFARLVPGTEFGSGSS